MTPPVPHRAITTVLTLVAPLAIAVVPFVVVDAWASQLPDPVAVHFGPGGADGFSSLAGALWPAAIVTVVIAVACWVVAFFWGRTAMVRRIGAATALGMAAFLAALVVGTLSLQRGLTDAADVVAVDPMITLALCAGLGSAALGAWLAPADAPLPTTEPVPARAALLDLAPHESATWVTHATSRLALLGGGAGVVLMLALGLALSIPALLITAVVMAAVVLSSTWFTVTVDRRGLTVRSAVGWPRLSVPLDEVVQAEAVTVSPFAEFGGWGYRVGSGGRVGVVLRAGDGLQVERSGARSFVVTVDDAATGAALLNTLAARSRVA